jgi:hypothetical protein
LVVIVVLLAATAVILGVQIHQAPAGGATGSSAPAAVDTGQP